jgi:PPM family protein phosphatase
MLRVAEHFAGTDTGLARRANEDSMLARAPLFVVADGMGGAQAGEVASSIAVESFRVPLSADLPPGQALVAHALAANERIYELSRENSDQAGMGTTLTAVYVGEYDVSIAHVGDSRAYCLRAGELLRLTDDHSLVDEMIREGRLTPEEAEEHPQRSIITRALGPEETVEVDTRSFKGRPDDIYLLCSDGLTSMVPEARLAEILRLSVGSSLRETGEALIAEANRAGGRDNITVVLLRLEEVDPAASASGAGVDEPAPEDPPTLTGLPAVALPASAADASVPGPPGGGEAGLPLPVAPRRPRPPGPPAAEAGAARRRLRRALPAFAACAVLALLAAGGWAASRSVYFLGTDSRGFVTVYRGFPYELPAGVKLYSGSYVSGVASSTLSPARRRTLLDHSLRSEADASSLLRSLELEELSE